MNKNNILNSIQCFDELIYQLNREDMEYSKGWDYDNIIVDILHRVIIKRIYLLFSSEVRECESILPDLERLFSERVDEIISQTDNDINFESTLEELKKRLDISNKIKEILSLLSALDRGMKNIRQENSDSTKEI